MLHLRSYYIKGEKKHEMHPLFSLSIMNLDLFRRSNSSGTTNTSKAVTDRRKQ